MGRYAIWALALGLMGALLIEVVSNAYGVLSALTSWAWVDALIYALMTLAFALAFARRFRRSSWRALLWLVPLFLLLYAPLTGVVAGLVELTLQGGWQSAALVRGALLATPVNLIYTLALELPWVMIPYGVIVVVALWQRCRAI